MVLVAECMKAVLETHILFTNPLLGRSPHLIFGNDIQYLGGILLKASDIEPYRRILSANEACKRIIPRF